ncbi:MAG: metallophosphoesterase, partial [Clostridiales bacterium]|nr:metallophosphoesterase [Clostridiales bacterium]
EDDDTVIINGDISWAMKLNEAVEDLKYIDSLKGHKILMKGNHDLWWGSMAKMEALVKEEGLDSISFMYNNAYDLGEFAVAGSRGWFFDAEGDDLVLKRECGRIQRSIDDAKRFNKEIVLFLHYPPISITSDCQPILDVLLENGIKHCYYAHLHGNAHRSAVNGEKYGIDFNLVSADYLKFCPKLVRIYGK